MESPSKSVFGGGLVTAFVLGGLVGAAVLVDPGAPPARAADALTPFDSCAELQSWYVEHTIDQVGPYGWGGRAWTARESGPMEDSSSSGDEDSSSSKSQDLSPSSESGDAVSNGETGTNTQEAGVDEPDVAKTDGRIVVRLVENRRLVVTDVSGESAREIADWVVPADSYASELLLVGDHVHLTGERAVDVFSDPAPTDRTVAPSGTELYDVDVSDPANPRLDSRTSWPGRQLSLRQYDDTVRLVTSTGLPRLPFVEPRSGSDSGFGEISESEAAERNREIVRDSTVEDWAPGLDCSEVYHPRTWSGAETVSVATFRPGAVDAATKVAVTGAASEVYSSADRLYVTATDGGDQVVTDRSMTGPDGSGFRPMPPTRTHIHAFALEGDSSRYLASGAINGSIRNSWSLDEYDGHLRVAVSWPGRGGDPGENGVVVLDERDGRLETVGQLRGLGVNEQIQSVRWFDDLAVVVTFRQTDPLYTIDLTNPTQPRRLGELKILGFSSYLHPIGDDRLLGLGTDASPDGLVMGAQAAVFDIRDRSRARQVDKVTFGESVLGASEDPHAFTWLPESDAAITTLQRSGVDSGIEPGMEPGTEPSMQPNGGPAMVLLRVSPSGELSAKELPAPGGFEQRSLPLDNGRVALTGSTVTIVDID